MTAPRWEDAVTPLVQSEVNRLEEHLRWARQRPATTETERAFRDHEIVRIEARIAPLDAALARLAEPAQGAVVAAARRWLDARIAASSHPVTASTVTLSAALYAAEVALADAVTAAPRPAPTAAERWRAVPADVRRIVLRWVERGQAQAHRDNVDAYHALTELAREAEGGGR